jgi:predicted DNA-binding transcriptional regulator AlpA
MSKKRYSRMSEVQARYGDCSRSKILKSVARGLLPKPVKFGRHNLWDNDELDENDERMKEVRDAS